MSKKYLSQCEVGDKLVIGGSLYTITKVTKTQFHCLRDGTGGGGQYDVERVMLNSGKVVGDRHQWASVLETTPEEFYAEINARKEAKRAESDARAKAWNDKVALVRARNSNIIVTDEGMGGLKKAVMVDSKDEPMIVYFDAQPEEYWQDYRNPPVSGFRIRCSTWRKDWGDRYGFSQTDARGLTIEDALVDLVAAHYWN